MKVVVCIKQVRYVYGDLPLHGIRNEIDPEKVVLMINPYDEIAVEEAARIKERYDGCEIILVTVGPRASEESLRYSYAIGGDRMIRVDFESDDPWSISAILAEVIKDLNYDVILCGKKAIDTNAGLVGSFIAESLKIPQVSRIVRLELLPEENKAVADRYLGRGDRQVVECGLPALFTVEKGLNDPRYPSLRNKFSAEREVIEVIETASLGFSSDNGMDMTRNLTLSPPRPRPRKIFTPESNLSASERMRLLMRGHRAEKTAGLIEGNPEDIAGKVAEILIQERVT
jgi:electron transfer flavoprotein beta subunit